MAHSDAETKNTEEEIGREKTKRQNGQKQRIEVRTKRGNA
jgi:hypothetical protein